MLTLPKLTPLQAVKFINTLLAEQQIDYTSAITINHCLMTIQSALKGESRND